MANTVSGLFGMQSPQQLQQDYLSGLMVSPAQMGQQGLLQQLTSVGANAGAMMGYGGGRLLGGKVAGEVEAGLVNKALKDVNEMGITDPAQKMAKIGEILSANPATAKQGMIALQEANKLKVQGYEMGAMERDENYRKDLAALGANPTTAQITALDTKYGKVPEVRAAATARAALEAETKAAQSRAATLTKYLPSTTPKEVITSLSSKASLPIYQAVMKDVVNPQNEFKEVNGKIGLFNKRDGSLVRDLGQVTPAATKPPTIVQLQNALKDSPVGSKEAREIQAQIDALGRGNVSATPPANIDITDINSMMSNVRSKLGGSEETINTAAQGLGFLKLGSPKAQAQVDRALASLSGDTQTSALEVSLTSNAGPLGQQIVDSLNKVFVGGSGAGSKLEKQHVLEASLIHNTLKYNTSRDNMIGAFETANMTKDQITKIVGPRKELPKDLIGRFVVASGEEFEPTKFDYRMLNNGAIVRSPKKK